MLCTKKRRRYRHSIKFSVQSSCQQFLKMYMSYDVIIKHIYIYICTRTCTIQGCYLNKFKCLKQRKANFYHWTLFKCASLNLRIVIVYPITQLGILNTSLYVSNKDDCHCNNILFSALLWKQLK